MNRILDPLQLPPVVHKDSKIIIVRAIARALDVTPGAAYTGVVSNIATTPPIPIQTTLSSAPLSSYDSIFAAVRSGYSPGQVPATHITPGYQGPTAAAEITATSNNDNSDSSGTASKALLSGTTLYAVIAGGAALLLIIIIVLSVWCWKRKKSKRAEANWWKGKDDPGTGLVSAKPSTNGHSSDGKNSDQEKHWGNSPTSSIPGKVENSEEFHRPARDNSASRDELFSLGPVRKASREDYNNNNSSSYGNIGSSFGKKGSTDSTGESSTLAESPPRSNYDHLPYLSKDHHAFSPPTKRYGSLDESKNIKQLHINHSRPSQYQYPKQNLQERQSQVEESEGNYTDFMVRSPGRTSLSDDGRISPIRSEKMGNRKKSTGGRKTDTILDFTDAYNYGNFGEREEEEEITHDSSAWGESKRKRNLSLTNPFVPLPLLLATSASSSDSFPPSPRSRVSPKSSPSRRIETQNDPRYGRIDSQPLHELESIVDSFGYKPRTDSRSTSSSISSPSLRTLSLVPKAATVVRPPPPVVIPAPSFAVSHPTGFNPSNNRSPIVQLPDSPESKSTASLPPLPLPTQQKSSPPTPPSTILPIRRGRNNRNQSILPPLPPQSVPLAYSRPRLDSNTSSSSASSRSLANYSSSNRSNPSPTSDRSYPAYFSNPNNPGGGGGGRQPLPTVRSDWETTSSSSRSMMGTRPSQESLAALRSRPNPERKGSYGAGSGVGGQGIGGGPIRSPASLERMTLRDQIDQPRIQQTPQPPARMEPVRSTSNRPNYTNLASVPESSSSSSNYMNSLPPSATVQVVQGRQAVTRHSVTLSPEKRASMKPTMEGPGARYRSAMSIYGMYDE